MKLPLETSLPYRLLALLVLAVFYGVYLLKQWRQKRRGIRTMQIGRGNEHFGRPGSGAGRGGDTGEAHSAPGGGNL